jgi:hypothetical protein
MGFFELNTSRLHRHPISSIWHISQARLKRIDLPVSADYCSLTQASEYPASQPVRRQ